MLLLDASTSASNTVAVLNDIPGGVSIGSRVVDSRVWGASDLVVRSGTVTTNVIPKWSNVSVGSYSLVNSLLMDSGVGIGVGTNPYTTQISGSSELAPLIWASPQIGAGSGRWSYIGGLVTGLPALTDTQFVMGHTNNILAHWPSRGGIMTTGASVAGVTFSMPEAAVGPASGYSAFEVQGQYGTYAQINSTTAASDVVVHYEFETPTSGVNYKQLCRRITGLDYVRPVVVWWPLQAVLPTNVKVIITHSTAASATTSTPFTDLTVFDGPPVWKGCMWVGPNSTVGLNGNYWIRRVRFEFTLPAVTNAPDQARILFLGLVSNLPTNVAAPHTMARNRWMADQVFGYQKSIRFEYDGSTGPWDALPGIVADSVNLRIQSRASAGRLLLGWDKSGSAIDGVSLGHEGGLNVVRPNSGASEPVQLGSSTHRWNGLFSQSEVNVVRTAAALYSYGHYVTGDSQARIALGNNGIEFGSGSAARDVFIRRTSSDVLTIAGDINHVAPTGGPGTYRYGYTLNKNYSSAFVGVKAGMFIAPTYSAADTQADDTQAGLRVGCIFGNVGGTNLGSCRAYESYSNFVGTGGVTPTAFGFHSSGVVSENHTVTNFYHFYAEDVFRFGVLTNQTGFLVGDFTNTGASYAFRTSMTAGANKYSIYTGTALSYFGGQIQSAVTSGTAPFIVASTTLVANLNAELWNGKRAWEILNQSGFSFNIGGIYWDGTKWAHHNDTGKYGWTIRHGDATGVPAGAGGQIQFLISTVASTGVGSTAQPVVMFSWDRSGAFSAPTLTSSVATGTAPLTVTSTTRVNNLNVQYLDGQESSFYLNTSSTTQTKLGGLILRNGITPIGFTLGPLDSGNTTNASTINMHTGNSQYWHLVARGDAHPSAPNTLDLWYLPTGGGRVFSISPSTRSLAFEVTPTVGANSIWHAGNDGAGSGLDADLWDGVHSSTYTASLRSGHILTGGGAVTFNSSGELSWGTRFIIICNGRGSWFGTFGYFDVSLPAVGSTITAAGGGADQVVTAGGIPMTSGSSTWVALYYILPLGSNSASVPGNFRLVTYTSDFEVPSHWVLIAVRNGDSNYIRLGNGILLRTNQTFNVSSHSHAFVPNADTVDGLHASSFSLTGHSHAWSEITSKPTTISGYGITDAYTKAEADGRYLQLTGGTLTGQLMLQSTVVRFVFNDTDAAVDNRRWDMVANDGQLLFRLVNDAVSVTAPWLTVSRSGTTVTSLAFSASSMTLNGAALATQSWVSSGYSPLGHSHAWADITSKPTTLGGFGITDAVPAARTLTFSGSGLISLSAGAQDLAANRTWTISTSMNTARLVGRTTAGAGVMEEISIGSGLTLSGLTLSLGAHTQAWSTITSTPTNLAGYGITDAVPSSRTVTASTGLVGGGDLTLNRSFSVDFGMTSGTVAAGNRGLPAGGTTGQALTKTSNSDYAVAWTTLGAGSGTVTSVGLSAPAIFSVSGSPVTGSGTLTLSLANQSSNTVWAGPTSGSAAPSFRALVEADIPQLAISKVTNLQTSLDGKLSTSGGTISGNLTVSALVNFNGLGSDISSGAGYKVLMRNDSSGSLRQITLSGLKGYLDYAIADITGLQTALDAKVPTSRAVYTTHSIQGGENLTADRTLSLVGDEPTPGNSKYYGTNSVGTRGWYALPTGSGNLNKPTGGTTGQIFVLVCTDGGAQTYEWRTLAGDNIY